MTSIADLLAKQKHGGKRTSDAKRTSLILEVADPEDTDKLVPEIQSLIDSNDIVVFSKSYCPYCRQAKMALRSVPNLEFHAIEMDDGAHEGWQAQVATIAKSVATKDVAANNTTSVPQIFIKQIYVGGADDIADMFADGRLADMLGRPLYP
jgi:glutaredoxin 3